MNDLATPGALIALLGALLVWWALTKWGIVHK